MLVYIVRLIGVVCLSCLSVEVVYLVVGGSISCVVGIVSFFVSVFFFIYGLFWLVFGGILMVIDGE